MGADKTYSIIKTINGSLQITTSICYAYNESIKEKCKSQMSCIKQYVRKVLTLHTSKDRKAEAASTDIHPCSNSINGLSFHSNHCYGVPQLFPFSLPGWSQLGSYRADTTNPLSPRLHHGLSSSPRWPGIHIR